MKINVIIPCYNEQNYIELVVNRVQENINIEKDKILVVDDCSTDRTAEKLINLTKKFNNIVVIKNITNLGKGSCIKKALEHIDECDVVIIQDADLEYNPKDYNKLISPFKEFNADIVFGTRYRGNNVRRISYFWHTIANNFLTFLVNILNNTNLTDMETGFKLFKKEVIKNININEKTFGFEPEVTIKAIKNKNSIFEVGISYNPRGYAEGKKIKFFDAIKAIYCIFKYSLFKSN